METFRTSARAVDMLGRQQIAGASTALSEVFKNAHDAYARTVRADLVVADRLLLLRDDGVGMSPDQFRRGWLTLATDTKVNQPIVERPSGALPRPVLGAKGIGRLAIAVVGPYALVLSRAKNEGLVLAFLNWEAFQLPGVALDEISVPVDYYDADTYPTSSDVAKLVAASDRNLRGICKSHKLPPVALASESVDPDSLSLVDEIDGPHLRSGATGTAFVIFGLQDNLAEDAGERLAASRIAEELLGFTNTMTPGHQKPVIEPSFYIHREEDPAVDVLGRGQFFTEEDFEQADHSVVGRFDELGVFRGQVRVYRGEPIDYRIEELADTEGPLRCGPFELAFAVIQPRSFESKISATEHARLNARVQLMGGIYVYRGGIRVLPYGRPNFDWLEIEQRRTQNLAKAFYSHRRMFGAVILSPDQTGALQEKAGREGFQQNAAYRQLRQLLQALLERSAADFFVKGGARAQAFVATRDELTDAHKGAKLAERNRKAMETARAEVSGQIAAAYVRLTDGSAQRDVSRIVERFSQAVDRLMEGTNLDDLAVEEFRASEDLRALRAELQVYVPPGVGWTRELRRDARTLEVSVKEFESEVLNPARGELQSLSAKVDGGPENAGLAEAVQAEVQRARHSVHAASSSLRSAREDLIERSERLIAEVEKLVTEELGTIETASAPDDGSWLDWNVRVRTEVERCVNLGVSVLDSMRTAIDWVQWTREDGQFITSADANAALDEEVSETRRSSEEAADLILQGMALSVVDHEFRLATKSMRDSLAELRAWSDLNPTLQPAVQRLTATFEHIDGFLTLFTPLQRRAERNRVMISGSEIAVFIQSLFGARCAEADVDLQASDAFRGKSVRGFRSTWYPVFVNLVDNAVYWVSRSGPPHRVVLDVADGEWVVDDSGPGVHEADRESIWLEGFSLKPGGKGLGLSISRDTLRRVGLDLRLEESDAGGARFRVVEDGDGGS